MQRNNHDFTWRRWAVLLMAGAVLALHGCASGSPSVGTFTYTNAKHHIQFDYPSWLEVYGEERDGGMYVSVQVANLEGTTVMSLSTYDLGMERIVTKDTVSGSTQTIVIGRAEGIRYAVRDSSDSLGIWGDGTVPHVLVKTYNRLYLFTGSGPEFDGMLASFQFVETVPLMAPGS